MISERTCDFGFVVLMSIGGLASGLLTAALSGGRFDNPYGLGIPFGVIVAFCLAVTGIARGISTLGCLIALTICSFPISVFFAEGLEIGALTHTETGTPEILQPIALFAGGMAGGFLVLGGALFLARPRTGLRAIVWKALRWSVLGGALAPIAWALGPSLGMWVWSGLHVAGLTSPHNTFSEAMYGESGVGAPNRLFALFVVWQTGMAFAMGINLRPSHAKPKGVEAT